MSIGAVIGRVGRGLKRIVLRTEAPYIDRDANQLVGYHCHGGRLQCLMPVEVSADVPLSEELLQPPGFISIDGKVFDLRLDGLYRFFRLPEVTEQRIVCTQGQESLLNTLGYVLGYGDEDDRRVPEEIYTDLPRRRVIGSCGTLARVARLILHASGIDSRIVVLMTVESWGGQDDGHTLLEVQGEDRKWFLYDPSFGVCFRKNGRRLTALEFSNSRAEPIELERLPVSPGYSRFGQKSYDYDFWIAERFLSEDRLREWYRRVGALPLLERGGAQCCPRRSAEGDQIQRVENHFTVLGNDEFVREFYPA
jgi:hypothetical protein